jgi:hypothetical protein
MVWRSLPGTEIPDYEESTRFVFFFVIRNFFLYFNLKIYSRRSKMNFLALPKIELHCHLDGSLRIETIIDIAQKEGIHLPSFDKN